MFGKMRRLLIFLHLSCLLWVTNANIHVVVTTSITPNGTNTTTPQPDTSCDWRGYVGAVIAIIFFGSNFVPVKKFETGDGIFFQWILCVAIWIAGLITNCIRHFPTFYPLAMLGGFLWATGNVCVVPIIKTIGLGLGVLIWGSFNLLSGWASGRFGWFGLDPQKPNNLVYNDISIVFAMIGAAIFLFVKSEVSGVQSSKTTYYVQADEECKQPIIEENDDKSKEETKLMEMPELSWEDKLSPITKKIIGCVLSIISGILYGVNFVPVIYIKNRYEGSSQTDIDYVFAHFCGIFATSTLYFVIYCMIKKNKPNVFPSAILPGLASGGIWAIADISWFVANQYLSEAVSFPIVTTGPGVVAALWGVLVFREIKGKRNFIIMGCAFVFTIGGAVFAGLSKA